MDRTRRDAGRSGAVLAAALVMLAGPLALAAQEAADAPLAEVAVRADGIEFAARRDHGGAILRVSGGGRDHRFTFGPGESPWLSAFDASGEPLADGVYTWELELLPTAADRADLVRAAARNGGEAPAALPRQSGAFAIADGFLADSDLREPEPARVPRGKEDSAHEDSGLRPAGEPAIRDDDDAAVVAGVSERETQRVRPAGGERSARPDSDDSDASVAAGLAAERRGAEDNE